MATPLIDPFGRRVRDLRISVTDRCNFRCTYCMPEEGLRWLPRTELLTYEEQARLVSVCVDRFGFDSVRITGGEPLVRAHLPRLVELISPLGVDISMTTNGVKLQSMAEPLARAGLRRINVSLDTLDPETFRRLARRDDVDVVVAGIDAALAAGLDPVKVNCVVIRGVNDHELLDLVAFGRDRGVAMRFIEFMPLDALGEWSADAVVPSREVLDRVDAAFPLEPVGASPEGPEPASTYRFRDGVGEIGVISSVSEPFCDHCDRVRVTAEGKFRTCLFALEEFDLRAVLRGGGSDDDLAAEIERAVATKWAGHRIGRVDFVRPSRSMSQIGG